MLAKDYCVSYVLRVTHIEGPHTIYHLLKRTTWPDEDHERFYPAAMFTLADMLTVSYKLHEHHFTAAALAVRIASS